MSQIEFTFSTFVPTIQKYYRCTPFPGKTHLAIAKHIQNGDDDRVLYMFRQLIDECYEESLDYNKMQNVDLFCLLLNLRIMSVSDKFEFRASVDTGVEKTKNTVRLDLYDILDKVTNNPNKFHNILKINEDLTVHVSFPKKLVYDQYEDIIVETIDKIETQESVYDVTGLQMDQKIQILETLPGNILTDTIAYITNLDKKYRINVFENIFQVTAELKSIELKLYDNSFFEFLKLIYNCNLEEQYYNRYLMVKHMGFLLKDVEEAPAIETKTYIKMYEQELDEQRKQQEKSNKSTGNMVGTDQRVV